ncbi:SMC-Scp complex subunit ScpB [Agrobacterium salinitolerans]|jgi:segregation and condensation protein B|uniref:SMC-Scp complex subunit ScpB n=1 Tax=Agrobacterium pusense TaxID=648995 RepID=A0AA44EI75_9HYPH|nr:MULTISPECIES: SMC-Scp complex subunit ScpB [Agrobacterium]KNY31166.1 transcriptional regulator [Agrobacterium sp. SUL3]MDH0616185.1 SMC-Scp complex subunit ScpB [Agrobacterium sp. GD03872]MDH0698605.1 SMC-Scp complex subunit ScpB [Agrobacterium sp. GD03871]MDH1061278.1 SMC-Scp complex subunit ScpB [Agrobacterium sp. GD03992]MDH2212794.1 SMC-Scp complex subunit ScpB [Agrobacterium sp. GD03643]
MAGASTAKANRRQAKDRQQEVLYDRELEELPPELRWREWMMRVEAVIFASAEPVNRETLARVVGKNCSIDLLIDDLIEELRDRPYELVSVAGGWQHRTRPRFAETIRSSSAPTRGGAAALSEFEAMVLMAVGYFQPVTRGELSKIFGKEVSRDVIGNLRSGGYVGSGPRSPTPGAPYTYVTTPHFLSAFGMDTLRDMPNIEALEDAGLLSSRIGSEAFINDPGDENDEADADPS